MRITSQHWQAIQEQLRESVGEEAFESWLQPLALSAAQTEDGKTLAVDVPTKFMRDWVVRHYTGALQDAIAEALGQQVVVAFNVLPAAAPKVTALRPETAVQTTATPAAVVASTGKRVNGPAVVTAQPAGGLLDGGNALDPRFTFESFVTGKSNEFAYAAAKRIADSDDIVYNPFFLYGGVGLGKTHLMHAMAWHILKNTPQRRVLYISSEKFVYQFIRSLRDKKTMDFKEAFRSVDVLMIDDIQFIAGKEASQEEFFHTFNTLIDMRKQVILTADKSPHEMVDIEERLKSRLSWGLTTEVHKPDMETRLAILEAKAVELGVALPKDVGLFLANRISSNVRELEGALNRLVAHADLVNKPITMDSMRDLLSDLFQAYNRAVTLDEIQMKVADFYRIKLQDMHNSRRSRDVARPRQVAMYLAKNLTSKSFPEIGRSFGGRDHTTVMHAVKTIDTLRSEDPTLQQDLKVLESLLTGNA